ncbi:MULTISPECIES: hypothetical protein [unclassified Legionella]|uniref:hypothetical protein n=1 Tax=unclassified Legionella TaxID=2622702 RepID=UPI0010566014|nr:MULTISPECIES: hypothetical protein [unclassified Legionella]MDI9818397.1 hypothetical protein [Legionella sp. PL877]
MDSYSVKRFGLLPAVVFSFVLLLAAGSTASAKAASPQQAPGATNYIQLAYYHVHNRHRDRHWGSKRGHYRHHTYWTGWRTYHRRHGIRCQRSCLVNRWNGAIIRCVNRCI